MSSKTDKESLFPISKKRLEFLFDGIFAISMTILVLELKVPDLTDRHSVKELVGLLLLHRISFISYILSFFMLGILWFYHNRYYRYFQRITKSIFFLTLAQLAAAAFFPFCAALFGKYPINRLSIVIYLGCVLVYFWSGLIQLTLAKRQSVLTPKLSPVIYGRLRKGSTIGSIVCTFMFLAYLSNLLFN